MSKSRRYFSIITRETKADRWAVQFGDYDRETVEDELADAYADEFKARIICTADDQASIMAEVARLNEKLGFEPVAVAQPETEADGVAAYEHDAIVAVTVETAGATVRVENKAARKAPADAPAAAQWVDVTPTWAQILPILLMLARSDNPGARDHAEAELARMAALADRVA